MQLIFNYFLINNLIVIQQYKVNNVPLDKSLITCLGKWDIPFALNVSSWLPLVPFKKMFAARQWS
jgi:hypothetical protein